MIDPKIVEHAKELRARDEAYEAERAKVPSELQERVAGDVCDFFGIEVPKSRYPFAYNPRADWSDCPINPLEVEIAEGGRYSLCTYTYEGITLIGHYLWGGGDRRYHRTSSPWLVRKSFPSRFFRNVFRVNRTRYANHVGDIADWLE